MEYVHRDGDEGCAVRDREETIEAEVPDESAWVERDGERYFLSQLHLHTPSEHTVAGAAFPMEQHLVHVAEGDPDRRLVVGVLLEGGAAAPTPQDLVLGSLPAARGRASRSWVCAAMISQVQRSTSTVVALVVEVQSQTGVGSRSPGRRCTCSRIRVPSMTGSSPSWSSQLPRWGRRRCSRSGRCRRPQDPVRTDPPDELDREIGQEAHPDLPRLKIKLRRRRGG